ncbi:OmpA family protein [Hyunsoonleella pacifica]|uniref:OmpA family protein n=1 Tax=Hyunsoonleella pacifica TaxID=1080224 RepID=A0A4Q9FWW6_9FLAO|nr:OmpA family protein [Hyunsoonleella pacifica]TBN18842.1 OmpA family protein [Hyunsoonleella pacifica]GGD05239.1 hypothetical protein GCM10011368_03800 [Hyunsoonleella pacifica]
MDDFEDTYQEETTFTAGTDLTISLVAILTLLLASYQIKISEYEREAKQQEAIFDRIEKTQLEIIESFAKTYSVAYRQPNKEQKEYIISFSKKNTNDDYDIKFFNNLTSQKIIFGENILFESGKYALKKRGENYIETASEILKEKRGEIQEIRILGHADTTNTRKTKNFNLRLASNRAQAVYSYMRDFGGINPAEQIISAASYAEYMPVNRDYKNREYDNKDLREDNATFQKRAQNRRIEMELRFYEDF